MSLTKNRSNADNNNNNYNNTIILDDPAYDFKARLQIEKLTTDLGLKRETSKFLQSRHTPDDIISFLSENEESLNDACWLYPVPDTDNYDIVSDDGSIIKLDWHDAEKPIYTIGSYFYVIFTKEEGLSLGEGKFTDYSFPSSFSSSFSSFFFRLFLLLTYILRARVL